MSVYIALMLTLPAGVMLLFAENPDPRRTMTQVVRLALTVMLCIFLYRGNIIAKWLTVATSTLGGGSAVLLAISGAPLGLVIGGLIAALYLSLAWLLVWSTDVNAFLAVQRGETPPIRDPIEPPAPAASVNPGELAWLPADLHYLIEPALRCGLKSEWEALEYLDKATQDDQARLAAIADRIRTNHDYPRVKSFLDDNAAAGRVECEKLRHFFTLLKHFGLKFERG